jgi:molybdopterin-guanine dinucleotide biosynthesis protein A
MIIGVVLTGGSSRRMGRTKALVEVGGVPMASIVAGALVDAGCSDVVALGGDPVELSSLDLKLVPDVYPGQGPLGAVISALNSCGSAVTGVAVVACDLPWVTGSVLAPLLAVMENQDIDVAVASTGRLEPVCAVWNVRCLGVLREMFAKGERSLHTAIAGLASLEIPVEPLALRNINTPADLQT